MKRLPWILFTVHFFLASLIFGISFTSPARAGLPIIVSLADYPASLFADWLTGIIDFDAIHNWKRVFDCLIYILIGSSWFYLIGAFLRLIAQKLKK